MRKLSIAIWLLVTLGLTGYLLAKFTGSDRRMFLPGPTSHGHYQIELNCNVCHTPMMSVKQESCLQCHEQELRLADDSHPSAKFLDPRNADRVAALDARNCITCHVEHQPARTHAIGLTLPVDYCFRCHSDIADERPTHKGLAFDSCATAGCHNFHDNRALHEDFLAAHLGEPDHLDSQRLPARNLLALLKSDDRISKSKQPATTPDAPPSAHQDDRLKQDWLTTAHARAGVNCNGCHATVAQGGEEKKWNDHPDHRACASCHAAEVAGFLAGKHGMRLAQELRAMTPGEARLSMRKEADHRELGCASCHAAHRFDVRAAAAQACTQCHNDEHTRSYEGSPHHRLWLKELEGKAAADTGVSCATCHLPREIHRIEGESPVTVQHNQNDNLRPRDKMLRQVCGQCHGIGFAIDALADDELVRRNFRGLPVSHLKSMDMVRQRLESQPSNRKSQP
ncbi:MAG: cytochrome c3 family protein [Phycisphaeraceae bacterium]